VISEELFNEVKTKVLSSLELPTQNLVLKSAFTGKTKCERMQAIIELDCSGVIIDQFFLSIPQPVTNLLLGMDFCVHDSLFFDFLVRKFILNANESQVSVELSFVQEYKKRGTIWQSCRQRQRHSNQQIHPSAHTLKKPRL